MNTPMDRMLGARGAEVRCTEYAHFWPTKPRPRKGVTPCLCGKRLYKQAAGEGAA